MNKKFLGLLILPTLALAACSGSGYKKVKYLSVGGAPLVTEKGVTVTYDIIATYKFVDSDIAAIRADYPNFPESFVLDIESWNVNPEAASQSSLNKVAPKVYNWMGAFELKLVEGTEVTVKSYAEYFYKQSANALKIVTHKYEGLTAECNAFDIAHGDDIGVVVKTGAVTPTTDYEVVGFKSYKVEELERFIDLGEDVSVTYAFEK